MSENRKYLQTLQGDDACFTCGDWRITELHGHIEYDPRGEFLSGDDVPVSAYITHARLENDELGSLFGALGRIRLPSFKMPAFKMPSLKMPSFKINTSGLSKSLSSATRGLSKGFSGFGKSLSSAGQGLSKGLSSAASAYGKGLSNVGKSLGQAASGFGKSLSSAGSGLGDLASQVGQGVGGLASGVLDTGLGLVQDVGLPLLDTGLNAVTGLVGSGLNAVTGAIGGIGGQSQLPAGEQYQEQIQDPSQLQSQMDASTAEMPVDDGSTYTSDADGSAQLYGDRQEFL